MVSSAVDVHSQPQEAIKVYINNLYCFVGTWTPLTKSLNGLFMLVMGVLVRKRFLWYALLVQAANMCVCVSLCVIPY